ncbi:MAG: outer membrane beta-barrel protein [Chrysiogenetes bacterium]|nr:outer membrane beta-barrel protein [Chrysiogenetes bacterium]
MIRRILIVAVLVLGIVMSLAPGAQAGAVKRRGGPFHVFTSFKGGVYLPRADSNNPGTQDIKDIYGKADYLLSMRVGVVADDGTFGVRGSWTIPGTLALSVEGSFYRASGSDINSPTTDLVLYMVPVTVGLEYGFRYSEEQLLVPYVGVGYGGVYFRETLRGPINQKLDGGRFGWSAEAGLRILLDSFDRAAERSFQHSVGVTNTFVDFRMRYQSINGFDTGFDFTGLAFDGGLTVEF